MERKSIFDKISNEKFFSPLSSPNARIYYRCIVSLMNYSLSEPVIPYDIAIKKAQKSIYIEDGKDSEKSGAAVLQALIEAGWLTPKRLTSDNIYITTITKDCAMILSYIKKYAESGSNEMINHLYAMMDILKNVFEKKSSRRISPYHSVFVELIQHREELAIEMSNMYVDIDAIVKSIISAKTNEEYFDVLINHSLKEKFFSSYQRMKDKGRESYLRVEICNYIEKLLNDRDLITRTAKVMSESLNISLSEAEEKVILEYEDMRDYLANTAYSDYSRVDKMIDDKINSYITNLYSRFTYIFENNGKFKSSLNKYLENVQKNGLDNVVDLNSAINANSYMMVSNESVKVREKAEKENQSNELPTETLSEEEKKRRTIELKEAMQSKYSIKAVIAYFESIMKNKTEMILDNSVKREDALYYAAGMTFSGDANFPFRITALDYYVENEEIKMKNIKIERVGKND